MQLRIPGYCSSYRVDCNSHGSGTVLYIKKDATLKLLVTTFEEGIKVIFVEIDFRERERKWLSGCSCNPHKSKIENQLNI